jgi:hypothetical protein
MKRLFLLCITLAAIIAGLDGCTSRGWQYYTDTGELRTSGKDYNTYDYQGNRLMNNEGEWHGGSSMGGNRY